MAHFPKPFFRPSRNLWYVEINGKQHNLGSDKDQAFERYHQLMQHKPVKADMTLVLGVLDAFLAWVKNNKPDRTFEWYERHCQVFAKSLPKLLSVGQLKKHHLTSCIEKLDGWASSTKAGLCRAVCRAFQWAEDEELIIRSPLKKFRKPKGVRREVNLSREEFDVWLGCFKAECIRELFTNVWEVGCRPQEVARVEARHVDLENGRWVFPIEESKGKRFPRVVYLTDVALEITRKLVAQYPTGQLFRNNDGDPWNRHSLAFLFGRIQITLGHQKLKELGLTVPKPPRFKRHAFTDPKALAAARAAQEERLYERRKEVDKLARKHAKKYSLYFLRHAWATRALKNGLDALTVSILLGHTDPSTLAKVYAHLAHDPDYLRKAMTRAKGVN